MTNDQLLYVTETLLATAFYYGFAGGLVGWALVPVARYAIRAGRSFFQWR